MIEQPSVIYEPKFDHPESPRLASRVALMRPFLGCWLPLNNVVLNCLYVCERTETSHVAS